MASNKQIAKCASEFDEAQRMLQSLKDTKQKLQAQLTDTQTAIDAAQIAVDASLAELTAIVNE